MGCVTLGMPACAAIGSGFGIVSIPVEPLGVLGETP